MQFRPTHVLDIELSQPLADIVCPPRYGAIKALLRLHGRPVGYLDLPVERGRCSAATISKALLEQHSYTLITCHLDHWLQRGLPEDGVWPTALTAVAPPADNGPTPVITVAVCTRDRPADLARCLAAVAALDYPAYEVVVVDNAPRDAATARLVRAEFPTMRYVREERPGLDWARNRAIAEARGELVAFTDDDVVVDAGWLRALARAFAADPTVMAVTGLVVPFELETEPQALFEQYGGFGRGFARKRYRADRADKPVAASYAWAGMFGTGANMAYRKTVFAQIGAFDPALDVGTCTNGGGDIEMFFRIVKAGHTLVYEPAAFVRHRHRRDRASLARQIANNGVGFSAYLVRTALAYPEERLTIARFWMGWLRGWLLPRLWASLRGRERFPRDMIIGETWGLLVGLGRYPRARRVAAALAAPPAPPERASEAIIV